MTYPVNPLSHGSYPNLYYYLRSQGVYQPQYNPSPFTHYPQQYPVQYGAPVLTRTRYDDGRWRTQYCVDENGDGRCNRGWFFGIGGERWRDIYPRW